MFPKPAYKDYFGPEIRQNLINRYGSHATESQVVDAGYYYSLDMCIEFQRKSEGLLSVDWIRHISSEVYAAINEYVFELEMSKDDFISRVIVGMGDQQRAQREVNRYYNR